MKTSRSDAWKEYEDILLAQTVLQHIREGSTQLHAFEEVGEKLNRTAAACGFRWNSNVRKKYAADILQAKQIRQEAKNIGQSPKRIKPTSQDGGDHQPNINTMIAFLKNMRNTYLQMKTRMEELRKKLQQADSTLIHLQQEREKLLSMVKRQPETPLPTEDEDYKALLSIVQHANRLLEENRNLEIAHEKTG